MSLLGKLGMSDAPTSKAPAAALDSGADLGGDDAGEPDEAQVAAGEEFAAAVKSGDGAEIFKAFQGLSAAAKEY